MFPQGVRPRRLAVDVVVRVDEPPPVFGDPRHEVGIRRDGVGETGVGQAGRAIQLDPLDPREHGVAETAYDDADIIGQQTPQDRQAVGIQDHVGIDLNEGWGLDPTHTAVEGAMKTD